MEQQMHNWQCESCDSEYSESVEPAHKERHKGYRETVELWFCEDCVQ